VRSAESIDGENEEVYTRMRCVSDSWTSFDMIQEE
jgi:hypothetical protein